MITLDVTNEFHVGLVVSPVVPTTQSREADNVRARSVSLYQQRNCTFIVGIIIGARVRTTPPPARFVQIYFSTPRRTVANVFRSRADRVRDDHIYPATSRNVDSMGVDERGRRRREVIVVANV